MKRLFQTAGCGLLAAVALSGAASFADAAVPHDRPSIAEAAVHTGQKIDAPALYSQHCEMCHGPRGVAPAAEMSFRGRTWKHGTSSAEITKVIRDGVEATAMIAFKQKLSAAEIAALAKLVRSFDPALKPERAGGS